MQLLNQHSVRLIINQFNQQQSSAAKVWFTFLQYTALYSKTCCKQPNEGHTELTSEGRWQPNTGYCNTLLFKWTSRNKYWHSRPVAALLNAGEFPFQLNIWEHKTLTLKAGGNLVKVVAITGWTLLQDILPISHIIFIVIHSALAEKSLSRIIVTRYTFDLALLLYILCPLLFPFHISTAPKTLNWLSHVN